MADRHELNGAAVVVVADAADLRRADGLERDSETLVAETHRLNKLSPIVGEVNAKSIDYELTLRMPTASISSMTGYTSYTSPADGVPPLALVMTVPVLV